MSKFALVLISALVLGGCNRLDNHQPLGSARLLFAKTNVISQTFLSRRHNLNLVYICLRNPNRTLIPLKFELIGEDGSTLRSLDFSGGNIDNVDCTRFQFEPVIDSANRRYSARVIINLDPTLTRLESDGLRSGLYIEAHGGGDYLLGEASADGVITPYDLHFKTLYYQDLREVAGEAYRDLLKRFTQDQAFLIFFLLLLGAVIIKIKKSQ